MEGEAPGVETEACNAAEQRLPRGFPARACCLTPLSLGVLIRKRS